jgi:type II secretory pathway component GspD/PulD (secretin)
VLTVNNLAYEVKGGIITILTDAEYKALHGRSFYDNKQVKITQLRYAEATRVKTMLEAIKSEIGTIVADPITGTIILIDTPEKLVEMQAVIDRADLNTIQRVLPTETRTFSLQYAKVEDLQPEITAMLSKEAGTIRVDKRTQTLIVTDLPHTLQKVEDVVAMFDRRPKQVFIESKIVEVTLSDDFSLGVNWNHLLEGIDPRYSLNTVVAPALAATPVGRMTYNTIVAGGDLKVVLEALKNIGDTKILSNPQIAVIDGQEAKIQVVEDQPYKEIQLETGTTNISGVTYLFKKVGVQLAVTPRINDEKMISCKITPEISSISQWYDGAPQEGTPVIKMSTAATTVMVQDNVTIIIGGMIKDSKSTSQQGIPWLCNIPLLGHLFRSDSTSSVNTETVVFLTPRIISGEEPYLRMKDMKKRAKPLRAVGDEGAGKEFKAIR